VKVLAAAFVAVVTVLLAIAGCALHVARKCDIDARSERARCERESGFTITPPEWFRGEHP
jgi:hypothetical protein